MLTVEAILGRTGAGTIWQERLGFYVTWAYMLSAACRHGNKGKGMEDFPSAPH